MNNEKWKSISGHPEYEISSMGRIRSMKLSRVRILALRINQHGYVRCDILDSQGKRRNVSVHKIVALAFIGPRPEGLQINNIDGDKTNNASDNLEYCTASENMRHASEAGLLPNKLTKEQVIYARNGGHGLDCVQLSRKMGVSYHALVQAVRGRTWKHLALRNS